MENKTKSILSGSILTAAILAVTGFNADASALFQYSNLGSGEEIRASQLERPSDPNAYEMKCGEKGASDSSMHMNKKGKDHKCGEGKCGDKKSMKKKGKDHKCGEGKCGEGKCGGKDKDMKKKK